MSKAAAVLALMAVFLTASMTTVDARGGRTTAADCAAGSDDPDCPDVPDRKNKPPPTPPKSPPPPPQTQG